MFVFLSFCNSISFHKSGWHSDDWASPKQLQTHDLLSGHPNPLSIKNSLTLSNLSELCDKSFTSSYIHNRHEIHSEYVVRNNSNSIISLAKPSIWCERNCVPAFCCTAWPFANILHRVHHVANAIPYVAHNSTTWHYIHCTRRIQGWARISHRIDIPSAKAQYVERFFGRQMRALHTV